MLAGGKKWDQFKENEKKFGVTSTYNEEMYTTKLNQATLTPEQRARAARMAAEIEGDTSGIESNPHLAEERVRAQSFCNRMRRVGSSAKFGFSARFRTDYDYADPFASHCPFESVT